MTWMWKNLNEWPKARTSTPLSIYGMSWSAGYVPGYMTNYHLSTVCPVSGGMATNSTSSLPELSEVSTLHDNSHHKSGRRCHPLLTTPSSSSETTTVGAWTLLAIWCVCIYCSRSRFQFSFHSWRWPLKLHSNPEVVMTAVGVLLLNSELPPPSSRVRANSFKRKDSARRLWKGLLCY